jgi:hypothetical protein
VTAVRGTVALNVGDETVATVLIRHDGEGGIYGTYAERREGVPPLKRQVAHVLRLLAADLDEQADQADNSLSGMPDTPPEGTPE